jgi:hypothetical protein
MKQENSLQAKHAILYLLHDTGKAKVIQNTGVPLWSIVMAFLIWLFLLCCLFEEVDRSADTSPGVDRSADHSTGLPNC